MPSLSLLCIKCTRIPFSMSIENPYVVLTLHFTAFHSASVPLGLCEAKFKVKFKCFLTTFGVHKKGTIPLGIVPFFVLQMGSVFTPYRKCFINFSIFSSLLIFLNTSSFFIAGATCLSIHAQSSKLSPSILL